MKISRLTHKNIKPYGTIIDSKCAPTQPDGNGWGIPVRSKSAGWRIAYLILRNKAFRRLERHPDTLEMFDPVKGKAVIALALPETPDRSKLFYLDKPVVLKKGIWHALYTITPETHIKIFENIKVKCVYTKIISSGIAFCAIAISCLCSAAFIHAEEQKPAFILSDPGTENIVDYEKYGVFEGIGTYEYRYRITDKAGLAKASGSGIDPNYSVSSEPAYPGLKSAKRLTGNVWTRVGTRDPAADFFVWAMARREDPGVRLFFTARALEKCGYPLHALKAYRAAMLLYPTSFCWNREGTWTWLIAPAAWDSMVNLVRMHPELELKLDGTFVAAESAIGQEPTVNRVAVIPGKMLTFTAEDRARDKTDLSRFTVVETRGGNKTAFKKYSNGQWAMEADGKPFFVKGVQYSPTRVGEDYKWNWMAADENRNGRNDPALEAFVDTNGNGRQDADEPSVGDFRILKELGCNTIRIFNTYQFDKELLRGMWKDYGIKVLVCDPLGAYTIHSGADWKDGTDYKSSSQREKMKGFVRKTVEELKGEEWLLGYILGNENNMPGEYMGVNASRTKANSQPEEYAKFLNEVAKMVHEIDPDHVVGVGNMGLGLVQYYAKYSPELDFIGINEYAGSGGFGALWLRARAMIDRPVIITEFGCDAYATEKGEDQQAQAEYLKNAWEDIAYNSAGNPGAGNCVGGIVFEYLDEWWKDSRGRLNSAHDTDPTFEMAFPDSFSQEEWLGIISQGNGERSPFLRQPRKAYQILKALWNSPV
jgi:hypothetical protein